MPSSIEILDRLIGFDTVSRRPNIDLIKYVRDILGDAGVRCELIINENRANANLFATVGPHDKPGVMLSGHTDVVPTEGQDWSVEPFRLTSRDGKLYGRGTTDMKGFVACAIRAVGEASSRNLHTPIHLALSYDEEIGCIGVRSLLEVLDTAPFKPAFCIVGEPTELVVATGHKGKTAARAVCHGLEVHSALAPTGVNAIHLASEFIAALRETQAELERTGAKDTDYDVPYSTVHAGIIKGGTALNIVPNRCTVDFEIRTLKGDDPVALLNHIESLAAAISSSYPEEGLITIEVLNTYPGLDTPLEAEVVAFVKSLTGANATTKVAFGTEAGLFDERLGVPTVVCGPGSMAQGHKPDEYIEQSQLAKCDDMLDALIERLST